MIALHNILVATDFGPTAEAALNGTAGHSLEHSAPACTCCTRWRTRFSAPAPATRTSTKPPCCGGFATKITADDRTTLKAHVVLETSDNPADAIAEYTKSANIDLIVIGTHGRGAIAQFLMGSVAERVVRTAQCPVLTVKHPEHEFVVPDGTTQPTAQG